MLLNQPRPKLGQSCANRNDVCWFRSNSTTCFGHLHSVMLTSLFSIMFKCNFKKFKRHLKIRNFWGLDFKCSVFQIVPTIRKPNHLQYLRFFQISAFKFLLSQISAFKFQHSNSYFLKFQHSNSYFLKFQHSNFSIQILTFSNFSIQIRHGAVVHDSKEIKKDLEHFCKENTRRNPKSVLQ